MDKILNDLLCKLKVLSKIQSGQKIIIDETKINILDCDRNKWDRFMKWWLGASRYTMIDKLNSLYFELKDMINMLAKNLKNNHHTLDRLNNEIISAVRGINNLMLTYQDDRTIVSQLETISENFDMEITRINGLLIESIKLQSHNNYENNINNKNDNNINNINDNNDNNLFDKILLDDKYGNFL